ncbi:MAG: rhodanese-like domain-containing protein [Clostridiaceae bacterium]|nr:hypothetical protein [Eubacteriales bacterium]
MKRTVLALLCAALILVSCGCANYAFEQTGGYIVSPQEALSLAQSGAVLLDVRPASDYAAGHIAGAINIPMNALTVSEPYENTLAGADQVASVMGAAGVTETDALLIYDGSANMQAARVQWTLNMYNNFNAKVVSGGFDKLAGLKGTIVETSATVLPAATYSAGDKQKKLIVNIEYIKMLLDTPEENTIILDARTAAEFKEGTIPGSVNIDYVWNNYPSGEYKSPMDLQSTYLNKGVLPEMKIIVFCKSGVRAAQTYTALKDAGYQDVRVYDGSWTEFVDVMGASAAAPSEGPVGPSSGDAS